MSSSLRRLYEDLRSISVTVVYPPGKTATWWCSNCSASAAA